MSIVNRHVLVGFFLCASLSLAARELAPLAVIKRSFPAAGTVHFVRIMYVRVEPGSSLPAADKSFNGGGLNDQSIVLEFEHSASHAKILQSESPVVAELVGYLGSIIRMFKVSLDSTMQTSVRLEASRPAKSIVSCFNFAKKNGSMTLHVVVHGYAKKAPDGVVNFIQALVCDDSLLSKYYHRVFQFAALGVAWRAKASAGSAASRTQESGGPASAQNGRRTASAPAAPVFCFLEPTFTISPSDIQVALLLRYHKDLADVLETRRTPPAEDLVQGYKDAIDAIARQDDGTVVFPTVPKVSLQTLSSLDDVKPYVKTCASAVLEIVLYCVDLDLVSCPDGDGKALASEIYKRLEIGTTGPNAWDKKGFIPFVLIKSHTTEHAHTNTVWDLCVPFRSGGFAGVCNVDTSAQDIATQIAENAFCVHNFFMKQKKMSSESERFFCKE